MHFYANVLYMCFLVEEYIYVHVVVRLGGAVVQRVPSEFSV